MLLCYGRPVMGGACNGRSVKNGLGGERCARNLRAICEPDGVGLQAAAWKPASQEEPVRAHFSPCPACCYQLRKLHGRLTNLRQHPLPIALAPVHCAGVNPGLRVVLMSATADAELFAGYFQSRLREPSGLVTIPGFTHPVTGGCWAAGFLQGA